MKKEPSSESTPVLAGEIKKLRSASQRIIHLSNQNISKVDFIRTVLEMLLEYSDCDEVELWIREKGVCSHSRLAKKPGSQFEFQHAPHGLDNDGNQEASNSAGVSLDQLHHDICEGQASVEPACLTENGSFIISNYENFLDYLSRLKHQSYLDLFPSESDYGSVAIIPLQISSGRVNHLCFRSTKEGFFPRNVIENYEYLASVVSLSLINHYTRDVLRERVKELDCLYRINRTVKSSEHPLRSILQEIVVLLPPALQYPDVAAARIVFDGEAYCTPGFDERYDRISANILIDGEVRGEVAVCYTESRQELDEGPFIREERNLINAVAQEVTLIIESRFAEENRAKIEEQLRQADRLATIGQLAAGVAHELNEPLGVTLGFAQLLKKNSQFPEQAMQDIEKIERASLHARDVIKKLMVFARQAPPHKAQVNLNSIIEEGLYFLGPRCAKSDIQTELLLTPNLPEVAADASQLHQVLVNLVVNAIQAMPDGGKLTIQTHSDEDSVTLVVKDTGIGMSEKVRKQIFLPFFTTKDISEGTGLGLAVAHGIVASHSGTIDVRSRVGRGTTFAVSLPLTGQQPTEEIDNHDVPADKGKHPGSR